MGSLGGFLVWGGGFPAISSKRVELGFEPQSVSTALALNPFPVCVVRAPRRSGAQARCSWRGAGHEPAQPGKPAMQPDFTPRAAGTRKGRGPGARSQGCSGTGGGDGCAGQRAQRLGAGLRLTHPLRCPARGRGHSPGWSAPGGPLSCRCISRRPFECFELFASA